MDLVELYLNSREIQRKITAATKPKRQAKMDMGTEPPKDPEQGDIWFDLSSHEGYTQSVLRAWDSRTNQWLVVSQAIDGIHPATVPNRNRRTYSQDAIRGVSATQIIYDEMSAMSDRGMLNTAAAAQVLRGPLSPAMIHSVEEAQAIFGAPQYLIRMPEASPDDIDEFRRALQEETSPIITLGPGHMTMQRIGEDPIEIPVHGIEMRTAIAPELITDARLNALQSTRSLSVSGTINIPTEPSWFARWRELFGR